MKPLLYSLKNLLKKFLPAFVIGWYHFALALLAALFYRFPSRGLKVIAVTGTNGKSTVVEMLANVFAEAGFKTASLSSLRFKILDRVWVNDKRMTVPGRFFVQGFLRQAKDQGCSHVVLEMTSEGVKQHRHRFIDFDTVVLTNLSPEHIESHGSFAKYRSAKGQLFAATQRLHALNVDDDSLDFFLRFPAQEKWGYGIKKQPPAQISHFLRAAQIEPLATGSVFRVGETWFSLKLLGEFNVANALAALAVAQSQGISLEVGKRALESMTAMPGRMEKVISEPFAVIVDYAFTPNALQKVYETIVRQVKTPDPNSKLICVLGACGGGRDRWKRPVLGEIAARFCHQIILTNEDPYDEDPQRIVQDIKKGIPDLSYETYATQIILDRRLAITQALKTAQPGDVVVVTGKGCEPSICLARGQRIPWDDRRVVREEIRKIKGEESVFTILPHPADLKIQVTGQTQAELFSHANQALITILQPKMTEQGGSRCALQVNSSDRATLLVDFLNQLLYLIQTNREVYPQIEFQEIGERQLKATMVGCKIKGFGEDVKAATYHSLEVKRQQDGTWSATVLFDV